jgi:hypothetical protein
MAAQRRQRTQQVRLSVVHREGAPEGVPEAEPDGKAE